MLKDSITPLIVHFRRVYNEPLFYTYIEARSYIVHLFFANYIIGEIMRLSPTTEHVSVTCVYGEASDGPDRRVLVYAWPSAEGTTPAWSSLTEYLGARTCYRGRLVKW